MSEIYLDMFIILCLCLLARGILGGRKVYDFPTLMTFVFISFVLPQAVSLVDNPGIVSDSSVEKVMLMTCICLLASWIGFNIKPSSKILKKFSYLIDDKKLFRSGIFLSAIGLLSVVLLQKIDIQIAENSNWTGPATIIYFFGNLRHIGFSILLNLLLRKGNARNLIGALFSLIPVLYMVVVAGRRASAFMLLITIGLNLFYTKKIIPPKLLTISSVVSAALLIPLLGAMRGDFWSLLFSGQVDKIDFFAGINRIVDSGDVLELRNAAMLIEATDVNHSFGLGAGFWNSIVFQYVPGQLLGYEFKQSLQFKDAAEANIINLYGTSFSSGSTVTGMGDSYAEFGFLGCLVFVLIAYGMRHLWLSSLDYFNVYSQTLYIVLVSSALLSVTHGVGTFFQHAIAQMLCVWIVWRYSSAYCRRGYSP
ncbi:MAG: hypothetical protein AAFV90_07110 [Cyanobacteria bacterium J06634_5]